MRATVEIPAPSALRAVKAAYKIVPAGTQLHRIHPNLYAGDQFNPTAAGNARFSPIRDAVAAIIPTIYAAETFDCAVTEIILRCPDTPPSTPGLAGAIPDIVAPATFAAYSHSVVDTTADLNLVDLTTSGQRKLGAPHNALLAGPRSSYSVTRAWAEAIHAQCLGAQGLYYLSYQFGPQYAVLLFGDRVAPGILTSAATRGVAAAPCHDEIQNLAAALSIEYVDL